MASFIGRMTDQVVDRLDGDRDSHSSHSSRRSRSRSASSGSDSSSDRESDEERRRHVEQLEASEAQKQFIKIRSIIWGTLTVIFALGLAFVFSFEDQLARWGPAWSRGLPRQSGLAARMVLDIAPVIVSVW